MYNNPNFFYYTNPSNLSYMNYGGAVKKAGLLSKLKGIKWGDILNNTSKTLNVVNQAIPIFYQVKPLFNNAKTMFKIANIIKSDDTETNPKKKTETNIDYQFKQKNEENNRSSSNQPAFFL